MTVNLRPAGRMGSGESELTARNLSVHFEGLSALEKIDLTVKRDEILGLIGPNGAGKTTFVNVLTGFQSPDDGGVHLGSEDITRSFGHR
jgi:branched-chain amino acid transport system ATP-binding protein